MSADTHKYGYATKGTSVVLYRSKELRKHQFFTFPKWQGGNYGTPSTAGSRPGTLSAAAWASMMRLGEEGYLEATERLLSTTEKLTAAFNRIDGIHVMGGAQNSTNAYEPALAMPWLTCVGPNVQTMRSILLLP
jgi:glutamate/tyrosine decarboxylase-like PLP-dependent enzyme